MFVKHLILIIPKIKTRHSTDKSVQKQRTNVRFSFIDIFQAFDVRLETSRVDCKVLDVL